jgi:hypothetical protein
MLPPTDKGENGKCIAFLQLGILFHVAAVDESRADFIRVDVQFPDDVRDGCSRLVFSILP